MRGLLFKNELLPWAQRGLLGQYPWQGNLSLLSTCGLVKFKREVSWPSWLHAQIRVHDVFPVFLDDLSYKIPHQG